MRRALSTGLFIIASVALVSVAQAQRWPYDWREPMSDLGGTWYMNGEPDQPCRIVQRAPDGTAEFINEHGSRAWGTVRGDRVWIPSWSDGFGNRGLRGRVRGDRIVWPDGGYWSREPQWPGY